MADEEKEKSEFGKGFLYCIGLFLKHSERYSTFKQELDKANKELGRLGKGSYAVQLWFYGARDHLHEMKIPNDILNHLELSKLVAQFRGFVLIKGATLNEDVSEADIELSISMAEKILRIIDRDFFKIETKEAEFP
jgi:hypothetical protein